MNMLTGGLTDVQKIGGLLISLGFLFLGLGILLFLDRGLLFMGNVLLLTGFPLLAGVQKTLRLFNPLRRKERARGIYCFFIGVALLLMRWALVGIVLELFGLLEMFAPFLPALVGALRHVPYLGPLLSLPLVRAAVDKLSGARRRPPSAV